MLDLWSGCPVKVCSNVRFVLASGSFKLTTIEAARGIPTRCAVPVLQIPQLTGGSKGRANTRSLAAEASWQAISQRVWENLWETMEVSNGFPHFLHLEMNQWVWFMMFPWLSCKTLYLNQFHSRPLELDSLAMARSRPPAETCGFDCLANIPVLPTFAFSREQNWSHSRLAISVMVKYRELMIVGCCSSRFFATFCDYPQLWIYDLHRALQDGAPKIAKLPYKWLYGRYNYS